MYKVFIHFWSHSSIILLFSKKILKQITHWTYKGDVFYFGAERALRQNLIGLNQKPFQ